MSRKSPIRVLLTMTIIGALVTALARFAYVAYILIQAGESLRSVSVKLLLIDVMELDSFALYGAAGGLVLGIVLVLLDLAFLAGRNQDYSSKTSDEYTPFVRDTVKARRMEIGDHYLNRDPTDKGDSDAV